MAWIESHQELWRHPKTKKLTRLLEVSLPTVVGHLHGLWYWSLDFAQDGDLSRYEPEEIADAMMWEGNCQQLVTALVEAGFLELDEGEGMRLHDWDDYAGKLLDRRVKDRERKQKEKVKKTRSAGIPRNSAGTPTDSVGIPTDSVGIPSLPYLTEPNSTVPNQQQLDARALTREEAAAAAADENQVGEAQLQEIFSSFEENVSELKPHVREELKVYCVQKQVHPALILAVIHEAAKYSGRTWAYVKSILDRCLDQNITTIAQWKESEKLKSIGKRAPPGEPAASYDIRELEEVINRPVCMSPGAEKLDTG